MLLNAYTLYDCKALTYSPPFYATAHGSAVRMVMDLAADPNTSVGRHPADYTLFCVGMWNDSTGNLLPNDVREHISDVLPLAPKPPAAPLFDPRPGSDGGARPAANGRAQTLNSDGSTS